MPTGSNGRQGRTGRAVRANQLALLALVAVVAAEAGAEASRGRRHPAQWSRLGPRQQRLQQHARQLRQQGTQLYAGVAGATSVEQHVLVRADNLSLTSTKIVSAAGLGAQQHLNGAQSHD